jgi:hypothetical protein
LHTEAQRLLAEAELRAERTAAALRLVVAVLLGIAALLVAIGSMPEANVP